VRLALGVSRARLVRYLLLESTVLALLGGVAGLALAQSGGQLLRAYLIPGVEWQSVFGDGRTLISATLATVAVGLCATLVPLAQARRYDVISALKTGTREGYGRRSRLRNVLIMAQVTLSVVLLIGAGLFVRSVRRVTELQLGYDPTRFLIVDLRLRTTTLDSAGQVALRRSLLEQAQRSPVVTSATLACSVPFSGTCSQRVFVDGVDSTNRLGEFVKQIASPDYFETVGTRIVRGRGISKDDRAPGPLVAVVSDAMARVLWPGQDALGKCFRTGADTAPCRTVIGIAENVRQERIGDDAAFEYYIPAVQDGEHRGRILVRVRGDAAAQVERVRRDLAAVMPSSGYLVVRPMSQPVANVTRSWRLGAVMFVAFGALALVVAAIGLYSVVAYDVAQRRHEMGVRIALGARWANIIGLVVGQGLRLVLVGTIIGVGLTGSISRWLGPLLFQVSPRDPLVFGAVTLALLGVAAAASGLPAFHASRVDPASSLRSD
jgi:predicted permease